MSPKITILDVASAAGVSRGAVTRAFNGASDINAETKQRVLEAASRLGYRPNRFARNFAARTKARALGYVVASFRNPYFTDLAAEVLDQARQSNWQILVATSEGSSEIAALESIVDQVDLVIGHFSMPGEAMKTAAGGIPIINLEERGTVSGVHSIEINMRAGIEEAVAGLYARGARHLAMIDANHNGATGNGYAPTPRCALFLECVDPRSRSAVVADSDSFAGGERALRRLMDEHPRTDAVLVFNDVMAIGAMQGARAGGLAIPDRLRIVGIDGLPIGEALSPPLSSLAINRPGIVREAFALAERLAVRRFGEIDSINLESVPRVVWRGSA